MTGLRRLAFLGFVLAFLAAGAAVASVPRAAPPVSGPDLFTGKRIGLAQLAGRPVVVALWASWCGGCVEEAKMLVSFRRRHPGVAFLGIDNDESRAQGRAFARSHDLPGPSIFDPGKVRSRRLGAVGLPTTFFLDRRHRIVAEVIGTATTAKLERGLRKAQQR
jgi:thiol-disulfide isomerase/thioredoxin